MFANQPLSYEMPEVEKLQRTRRNDETASQSGVFIQENGDVLFRVFADTIDKIVLKFVINDIDLNYKLEMEKQPSGFHEYYLKNDGRFNGPLNCEVTYEGTVVLCPYLPVAWSVGRPYNYVEFPSHKNDFCMVRDVPHGKLEVRIYYAKEVQRYLRCLVYVPYGYESSGIDYPVLYLQHGGGENETVWESTGKISAIMDNAIAEGKCVPFVVVMNNAQIRYPQDVQPMIRDMCFPDVLIGSCIPFIEKEYRVRTDKDSRAIAGLSMGSFYSNDIAMWHPEMFSYTCALTGCMFKPKREAAYEVPWKKIMLDEKGKMVKEQFRVFFQSATTLENCIDEVYEDNKICIENGVADMPGYRFIIHDDGETKWTSWRMGLNSYIRMLFREADAYKSRENMEKYY